MGEPLSQYHLDVKHDSHGIVLSYLFLSSIEGHAILSIQAKLHENISLSLIKLGEKTFQPWNPHFLTKPFTIVL